MEGEVEVEGTRQAEDAGELMDDTTAVVGDAAADTTPPEPGQDVGWADDEEDEKWSVLLDRTKCHQQRAYTPAVSLLTHSRCASHPLINVWLCAQTAS